MNFRKVVTGLAMWVIALVVVAVAVQFVVASDATALQIMDMGALGAGALGIGGLMRWSEGNHVVKGIDPVADAFAGTVRSDVMSMKHHNRCTFLVYKGVGTTGTSTITVNACDDFTPSNRTAIPFRYRRCANSADVQGALTAATAAGVLTTAGSSEIYVVEVLAEDLGNTGYGNVELTLVESVDSPVVGAVIAILSEPTFAQAIQPTVIS